MKIENTQVFGFEAAIRAMRNPLNSWDKSDSRIKSCGDPLIKKSTNFNNTSMVYKYGTNYKLEDVLLECGNYSKCKAKHLFTSNRQEGCTTVSDFYKKRFDRSTSSMSPKFLYVNKQSKQ